MYRVEFYSDKDNHSDIEEFLDELKEKSKTSKNDRIQLKQILFYYITFVKRHRKHQKKKLWELKMKEMIIWIERRVIGYDIMEWI